MNKSEVRKACDMAVEAINRGDLETLGDAYAYMLGYLTAGYDFGTANDRLKKALDDQRNKTKQALEASETYKVGGY